MPSRLEFERCAPWLPQETLDAFGREGVRLPLTIGEDGDILDDAGECICVVDHNRERPDACVDLIALYMVEAINAVCGYRIQAAAR
jgi:hypothetical protein